MNRQLISESSRDHGDGNERLPRRPLPQHPTTPATPSSKNFPSPAKLTRTPYPRHLISASTPNLREMDYGSLNEEEPIPPVPPIPARIPPPKLPTSPSISNLSRGYKGTIASPSTPDLQHHHHQTKSPAVIHQAEEKQLPPPPPPPERPRLPFTPSIPDVSRHFARRPSTATASPSTPNFGEGKAKTSTFKKIKSGVKNLLHRRRKEDEEEEPKQLEISAPTDFRQLELDKDLKPVGVIATEYVPGNLSVPRFGGGR